MLTLFKITKKDLIEKKKCLICSNSKLKIISQIYFQNRFIFFATAMCKKCGFVFRNIHPSNKWFSSQYQKRSNIQSKSKLGISLEYEKLRIFRYKQLYNFLKKKDISFKNLIDIGCATGLGLKIFQKANIKVLGIDTDKTRINFGRKKGINLKHNNIFDLREKKKFDLVIFLHTLEHLTDPQKAVKRIVKFMHHNSYIYIEVPNFKNLVRSWEDSIYLAHLSNFSESNLIYFLKKNNLEIIFQTFPQTDNGEFNLGFLCKKKTEKKKNKIKIVYRTPKLDKYKNNGKNNKLQIPYKINLDKINDISFAYKIESADIYKKLNDNFKRQLIYDRKIKKYVIQNKTFFYKEKKNKFLKSLKYKSF
jgi:2-polyprenyl-3-methyl-5-hydroxy-6-metoxy-1,4-benzoquinol methylase